MTTINAVFEGGGVKGIGLVGAIKATEEKGIAFGRVAGTSSGSIIAALLAAGYTAEELRRIVEGTPFRSFLSRGGLYRVKLIGPAARLFIKGGLYSGEGLTYWITSLLAAKGIRTFDDLPAGKLKIVASDITNGKLLVLPDDIADYQLDPGRMPVAAAVRMSASIPYFFDPVRLRLPRQQRGDNKSARRMWAYIVDGGLLSNFPLWLFDPEQGEGGRRTPVVGYQLVGKNETEPRVIRGPVTMFQAMFETMLQAHDERYIEKQNRERAIKIPTLGMRSTDFDLTTQESDALYKSGYDAARTYFAKPGCRVFIP
ncbi:patatin-like phospholipase family protein [Paenibacillus methanolicus]|uniref:NTE family protein n=1 Tax=Paenibacillus methanolicus TaxID=582686 RepID=A0A5S5CFF4_9BACL|nr:patatin-like phospholipase family protein [Paenibacillus methanolicus]TYP77889.1 NTE family protein [Paenibacillus methanolicus]